MAQKMLYSATLPLGAGQLGDVAQNVQGMIPYFVSGPAGRGQYAGYIGVVLHVALWLCAFILDVIAMTQIDSERSPGAYTYWLAGFATLVLALVVLLIQTLLHALDWMPIKEGSAPPLVMAILVGGATISATFTVLQMIAANDQSVGFWHGPYATGFHNATGSSSDVLEQVDAFRSVLVGGLICKIYIRQIMVSNQVWQNDRTNPRCKMHGTHRFVLVTWQDWATATP